MLIFFQAKVMTIKHSRLLEINLTDNVILGGYSIKFERISIK
jgi:hypothetical protein